MDRQKLDKILREHKKWVNNEGGRKADLRGADLRGAGLRGADLRKADLRKADLREADLREADLREADLRMAVLRMAVLREADLREADLRKADLREADIDFSAWPLWCCSFDVVVDKRIAAQLAYHFCRLVCDDDEVKNAQKALKKIANQFHRVDECGEV
ncbi:MAG: pentapeptide repeat-containing protein [Deltaproteobacteria bacterium]|nr:pentapeptide repeat-containing protein [Deltaproteobacteria bacterium]